MPTCISQPRTLPRDAAERMRTASAVTPGLLADDPHDPQDGSRAEPAATSRQSPKSVRGIPGTGGRHQETGPAPAFR
jgi:hypothetical protein